MSSAGPWSVKGIDPKAREIAKDLARRSGMTLGEWLNHMIIEGEEGPQPEPAYDSSWMDAPRTRSHATSFSATESLRARLNRGVGGREALARDPGVREMGGREAPPPIGHNSEAGELGRIMRALSALGDRIEQGEQRSTLSISGIDQQVLGVLGRIENAERDQTAFAARVVDAIEDVRTGQTKLDQRLRRFDGEEGARMEAIKSLEGALNKVAGQIYEGESRGRTEMSQLREDVAALVRRVDKAERAPSPDEVTDKKLETLATELIKRIDAAKVEAAERLAQTAALASERIEQVKAETQDRAASASDAKLDRLEDALKTLATQMGDSEKRSAEAVDRMGREVMHVAQAMATRVQSVETRSAQASEQMGSEMARIAEAMEGRMRRADGLQAEALEKLGGEIARIAEKLADRIAASERRSAGAMTHMGDQLAGVTERLNRANDQAAADLAARIRASEERTAKLLSDTRDSIDRRLADAPRNPPPSEFALPPTPAATAPRPAPQPAAFAEDPFGSTAEPAHAPFGHHHAEPFTPQPDPQAAAAIDPFDDFPPEQPFTTDPAFLRQPEPEPAPPSPSARSNRDLIASARAAARAAAESRGRTREALDPFSDDASAFPAGDFGAPSPFAPAAAEYAAPEIDAAAGRARAGVLGFGFPLPKRKKKEGQTLKTLLLASATGATLSVMAVGAVGLVAMEGKGGRGASADAPSAAPDPKVVIAALEKSAEQPVTPPTDDAAASGTERLAMAVSPDPAPAPAAPAATKLPVKAAVVAAPQPAVAPTPAAPAPQPNAATARTLYSAAVRTIEGGDASGVESLKKAANLGYGPAEFYLAKLYENGSSGLKKDPAEARRWTERAAQTGDSKAMHNLALYWFEGTGGAKDPAQAADWFKRAAERGVQDSQYNLARLYEQGFGVPKNAAEAYKWYLIAGAAGDSESKTGADTVKRSLTPEAQTNAERAASSFRAQIAASQLRTASTQ